MRTPQSKYSRKWCNVPSVLITFEAFTELCVLYSLDIAPASPRRGQQPASAQQVSLQQTASQQAVTHHAAQYAAPLRPAASVQGPMLAWAAGGAAGGAGPWAGPGAGAAGVCLKPLLSFPKAPPPLPGAGPALVSLAKLYVGCVGLGSHLPNIASIFWGWRIIQSQHCLQCLATSIPLLWYLKAHAIQLWF